MRESPEETQYMLVEYECPPLIVAPQWGDEERTMYNECNEGGPRLQRSVRGGWGVPPLTGNSSQTS